MTLSLNMYRHKISLYRCLHDDHVACHTYQCTVRATWQASFSVLSPCTGSVNDVGFLQQRQRMLAGSLTEQALTDYISMMHALDH